MSQRRYGRYHPQRKRVPWYNLRRSISRKGRKVLVACSLVFMVCVTLFITVVVIDENRRVAEFTLTEKSFVGEVVSQDLDDCSIKVKITDLAGLISERYAFTDCGNFLLSTGSRVHLVEDPDEAMQGDLYVVHPNQNWQAAAEIDYERVAIAPIFVAGISWIAFDGILLKFDRPARVARSRGVRPDPGRFEKVVLALQFSPKKVRFSVIALSALIAIGLGLWFIDADNRDFERSEVLVASAPHRQATLVSHKTSGRSGEPAKVDVDGRLLDLSWDLPGLRSMELGTTFDVVLDPDYPLAAIPVDFALGPDASPGTQLGNKMLAFLPSMVIVGLALRVCASRKPLRMFEPKEADALES